MSRRYPERPIPAVGAVVLRESEVLLVRRGKEPRKGSWSLPGGAQKLGETVREAALREVREETGLAVRLTGLIDVVDSITPGDSGRPQYHYTLIDFAAEWAQGEARAGSDAAEVRWVPIDRLGDYVLWNETRRIVRLAARQRGAVVERRQANQAIVVRGASEADDEPCGLLISAANLASGHVDRVPQARGLFSATSPLSREGRERLIAEEDGKVAGFVDFDRAIGHVRNLFVHPDHQGRGIGGRLLAAAEAAIGGPVTLSALAVNDRAIGWYLRRGYRIFGGRLDDWEGADTVWVDLRKEPF